MYRILILTDNQYIYQQTFSLVSDSLYANYNFEFRRSHKSNKLKLYEGNISELQEINVKDDYNYIIENYSMIISLHCKQIFPKQLVKKVKCINVHPGYNPYNRGWYPQVFAIINNTKIGATIHIMDEQIDHGYIIDREETFITSFDTSKEVYERVLDLEIKLLRKNLLKILQSKEKCFIPENEGIYHSIEDYKKLCQINLSETLTFEQAIKRLRALTHGDYRNAYFLDKDGEKIFVKIELSKEQ